MPYFIYSVALGLFNTACHVIFGLRQTLRDINGDQHDNNYNEVTNRETSDLKQSVQFSSFYFSSSSIHIYNQHKLEKPV